MTPEKVICVLKFFGDLTCTWPSDDNNVKKRRMAPDFKLWCVVTSLIGVLIPLLCAVYHHRHQTGLAMKTLAESIALMDVVLKILLCRVQRNRLQGTTIILIITIFVEQALLSEVDTYANTIAGGEKEIFYKSVNQYLPFCAFVGFLYLLAGMAFILGPLLKQTAPTDAWYPFRIELFSAVYFAVYIHHSFAVFQTAMGITVDFMVAFLLSYLSAKLQILNLEFRKVDNAKDLNACIKQHQELIRFGGEVCIAVRIIILMGISAMTVSVISGALPILENEPHFDISQMVLMVMTGCFRIYVTAWPADDVREASEKIAWSVYASPWVGRPLHMRNTMSIVVQRSRKPLVISIHGVLPAITLKFFAIFLSSSLSYFMTLRSILGG